MTPGPILNPNKKRKKKISNCLSGQRSKRFEREEGGKGQQACWRTKKGKQETPTMCGGCLGEKRRTMLAEWKAVNEELRETWKEKTKAPHWSALGSHLEKVEESVEE